LPQRGYNDNPNHPDHDPPNNYDYADYADHDDDSDHDRHADDHYLDHAYYIGDAHHFDDSDHNRHADDHYHNQRRSPRSHQGSPRPGNHDPSCGLRSIVHDVPCSGHGCSTVSLTAYLGRHSQDARQLHNYRRFRCRPYRKDRYRRMRCSGLPCQALVKIDSRH
jgi:hypothetical protein